MLSVRRRRLLAVRRCGRRRALARDLPELRRLSVRGGRLGRRYRRCGVHRLLGRGRGRRTERRYGLRRRGGRRGSERRGRGGLGRRGEGRDGDLRRCGGFLLGDLSSEVLQQRVEAAVEALADRGEPPDVLEVEVTEHDRPLGGELGSGEGVLHHFLAARDDPDVARTDLRHLPRTVEGRGEGQLVDVGRNAVEGDAERLGVTGLRAQELNGLLRRFRLVEEDEIPVVRELFIGIEAEAADVERQAGACDLHTYVQIRPGREITDLGLVAALEFPGHA